MKILYLPSSVMTSACIINRSNETISQLIRFRFSQELIPPGTNHSSSTTASIGSISKECGRLWLDHNGLFGPRIYPPLLLCSHRRHLCLHLLLLQRWKEFKFLAGGSEFFKNPHLVKCNVVMGQKTPPSFREGCNGPTDYYS